MSRDREGPFIVEGKTRDEILQLLDEFASERQEGPVWVMPLRLAGGGVLCEISRDPGYLTHKGKLCFTRMLDREAFEVVAQRDTFTDSKLFWQTVDELLRILGILRSYRASMNYDTAEKVARALIFYERLKELGRSDPGGLQKLACDLAGTSPPTLRKHREDPEVLKEMKRLKQDPDFLEELTKV